MSKSVNVTINKSDINRYAQQMRACISGMCACTAKDVDRYEDYQDILQQACKDFMSACDAIMYPNPARG